MKTESENTKEKEISEIIVNVQNFMRKESIEHLKILSYQSIDSILAENDGEIKYFIDENCSECIEYLIDKVRDLKPQRDFNIMTIDRSNLGHISFSKMIDINDKNSWIYILIILLVKSCKGREILLFLTNILYQDTCQDIFPLYFISTEIFIEGIKEWKNQKINTLQIESFINLLIRFEVDLIMPELDKDDSDEDE